METPVIFQNRTMVPMGDGWKIEVPEGKPIIIARLPVPVYHNMQEIANRHTLFTVEERQRRVLVMIEDWAFDKYPGYGITNFLDLTLQQAKFISETHMLNVTWGMYIILEYGVETMRVTQTNNALPQNQSRIQNKQ